MNAPCLLHWLASIGTLVISPAVYAINITAAPTPDPFPAVPAVTDWSTISVGAGSVTTTPTAFDTTVIGATNAASITTVLGGSATIPPSTNGIARRNDGTNNGGNAFLQTKPTGVNYLLLLAHLTNATGAPLNSIQVAYDYSSADNAATNDVEGLRAYWSVSGTPGSWTMIPELSIDPTGTLAAPQAMSVSIVLPAALPAGGTMFLLWADQNSVANPDASYHIDNFAATVAGPPVCSIFGTVSNVTRSPGANPADPADDTVNFSATVSGTGPLSPSGWTVSAPAAVMGTTGAYNTPQTFTGVPISSFTAGTLQVTVQDADALAACQATLTVKAAVVIGSNDLVAAGTPILTDGSTVNFWTFDEAQRTSTQTSSTQADHAVTSEVINLSTVGEVLLRADLDAITGTSSGFEAADGFVMEVIIDGGAPVSILGIADADTNGRLNGAATAPGPELPDATIRGYTQSYSFGYVIPAAANSVQIRFIGNSNSDNETFVVKNVRLSASAPVILASGAGRSTLDNKGTASAADDEFSGPLNISALGFAGVNWESNEITPRTGAYATNPHVFGPYMVPGGAITVTLHDQTTPAIVSAPVTIPLPPAPVLTATAPANIINNPDGTVTFESTVTSANAGPGFTVTGATASSNSYGATPITFTIPTPLPASPVSVTITDASYPAATQTLSVTLPVLYTIGQINLGAGLQDLFSAASDPLWVNDPGLRTLTMTAGVAADSVVSSQVIDLSTVGAVNFTAKFNIAETSTGTNLEIGDKFKAELVIDGVVQNLVTAYDDGDGASAVTGTGLNGPPDGYINGYSGAAGTDVVNGTVYAAGIDDYNTNMARDEFNTDSETADLTINNDFQLSAVIPASANSVQLKIYGAGFAGSETATVSDVLFSTGPVVTDSDGDGASNDAEAIMGTNPNDPLDVLRISQTSANPNILSFPTKNSKFYKLYSSADLTAWAPTTLNSVAGDGSTKQFDISSLITSGRRFFRIHVMNTDGPWN